MPVLQREIPILSWISFTAAKLSFQLQCDICSGNFAFAASRTVCISLLHQLCSDKYLHLQKSWRDVCVFCTSEHLFHRFLLLMMLLLWWWLFLIKEIFLLFVFVFVFVCLLLLFLLVRLFVCLLLLFCLLSCPIIYVDLKDTAPAPLVPASLSTASSEVFSP